MQHQRGRGAGPMLSIFTEGGSQVLYDQLLRNNLGGSGGVLYFVTQGEGVVKKCHFSVT